MTTISTPIFPTQFYAKKLGMSGCYFICICKIAENIINETIDTVKSLFECSKKKTGDLPWITSECYIYYPEKILEHLSGEKYTVIKTTDLHYPLKNGDYIIGMYEYGDYTHFVILDEEMNIIFDPYGNSSTVKNGKLVSLRIFRKA